MLVGFYWLDSWVRVMQALNAPQGLAQPAPREDSAMAALHEDTAQLRATLEQRERALASVQEEREAITRSLAAEQWTAASARLLGLQLRRAYAARAAELQAAVDRLAEHLATAERQAFSARGLGRQLHAAYAARVAELLQALEVIAAQTAEVREQVEAEAAARVDIQAQLDETRAALSAAGAEAAVARTEMDRLAAKIGSLEQFAESEVEKHAGDMAELTRRMGAALERANQAEATQAESEAQARRLQDALDDVIAERDDLARRLALAEGRLGEPIAAPVETDDGAKKAKVARGRKAKPEAVPARAAPLPAAESAPSPAAIALALPTVAAATIPSEGLLIGFRKPADWTAPLFVYFWETQPPVDTPSWPGVEMRADAYGWCVQRLEGVQAASLVFTDSAGHQTGNLRRDRDGWLDTDGQWSEERP